MEVCEEVLACYGCKGLTSCKDVREKDTRVFEDWGENL